MHVCMDAHAWLHAAMFLCPHAWMLGHGGIYACANTITYACSCMYAFPCMHVHIHACVHMHIHACPDVFMWDFANMITQFCLGLVLFLPDFL